MHRRIVDHYLAYSNFSSEEELNSRLLRDVDTWLTGEEAVEFGIADKIDTLRRGPHLRGRVRHEKT